MISYLVTIFTEHTRPRVYALHLPVVVHTVHTPDNDASERSYPEAARGFVLGGLLPAPDRSAGTPVGH